MGREIRTLPDGFSAYALAHKVKDTRAHFRISNETFRRWAAEAGVMDTISRRNKTLPLVRHVPPEFTTFAPIETNAALAARFNASEPLISRWRRETATPAPARVVALKGPPPGFAAIVATMFRYQAAKHFGVGDTVLARWASETNARFRPWRRFNPTINAAPISGPDVSVLGQAAHHLRRFFPNVYKAEILPPLQRAKLPDHGKGMFIVGARGALPAAEVIALAKAKGFNPDAWREI